MNQRKNKPSRMALTFFKWYCHPDYREEIIGDLMERFHIHSLKYGYKKANNLFIKEVLFLFRPAIVGPIDHLTNTHTMQITNQNKRLFIIITIAIAILIIPLTAMNFTNEVNWKIFDFIVAGILLVGTGLTLEFILRKIKTLRFRILFAIALFLALFLIWAELAVGIFGTPFAGS